MKNPFGMRTIKTGIAAGISILYATVFNSEFPIFIVIAAIVSMNKSVVSSFQAGKNRLIGTAFGALMGLVFILIFPKSNFILLGIGIMIVISFCNFLHIQEAISLSCIVFATITLNLIKDISPIEYSLNRFFDTLVGIVIALLVNTILKPYNNSKKIEKQIKSLKKDTINFLKIIILEKTHPDLIPLTRDNEKLNREIIVFENEIFRKNRHLEEICTYTACKQLINSLIIELVSLSQLDRFPFILIENKEKLVSLDDDFLKINIEIKEDAEISDTVFNFHLDRFLTIHGYLNDYINF